MTDEQPRKSKYYVNMSIEMWFEADSEEDAIAKAESQIGDAHIYSCDVEEV